MKLSKRMLAGILAAGMVMTSFAGCGGTDTTETTADGHENAAGATEMTEASGKDGKTLKFGCTNFSESLDPSAMLNAAWCVTRYSIGECLFKFDSEMSAQPNLCDTYTVDDNGINWEFHVRDGVKFSNGNAVTASSVVASIEYMYKQEKEVEGSSTPSTFMEYESITADDETGTVTIVTSKAYADLCAVLSYPFFAIMDVNAGTNMAEEPIGTGAYAVSSYDAGVSVTLKANEHYWNGEVPYENLEIIFIDDSTTKAMALQNGDVDVVENIVTSNDLETLRGDDNFNVSETIGMRCGFSYMNQKGVLQNAELRNAVLLALDSETMCNVTVGGMYTAGYSVLPSTLDYGYDKLTDTTPYDVEKAKKVLDDAGIVDSDGDGYRELDGTMINLNYLTYDSRNLTDFTEATATQLEAIGIKVTVNTTDADTEWNMLVSGEYDLLANNWTTVAVGDPYNYLDNWYGKSEANYCGYVNEEYDQLYEELAEEMDKDARAEIIEKLQQILIDDAAVMVHGYYNSNLSSSKSVTGADIQTADYYWITPNIKPAA